MNLRNKILSSTTIEELVYCFKSIHKYLKRSDSNLYEVKYLLGIYSAKQRQLIDNEYNNVVTISDNEHRVILGEITELDIVFFKSLGIFKQTGVGYTTDDKQIRYIEISEY